MVKLVFSKKIIVDVLTMFVLVLCSVLLSAYVGVKYTTSEYYGDTAVSPHDLKTLSDENLFKLGQHYFNQSNELGEAYDLKKARAYYYELLERGPKIHPIAWIQLGRIDFLEGKYNDAIYRFYKQLQYFDVAAPNAHYLLGLTYGYRARSTGDTIDWGYAEQEFQKYLKSKPESPWARTDLTWVFFAQGKFEEMISVLERGLEYHPNNPWLLNMYGLALLNTGRKEEARDHFSLAKEESGQLTVDDWGRSYPGNNPAVWGRGLEEFRTTIHKNIELSKN